MNILKGAPSAADASPPGSPPYTQPWRVPAEFRTKAIEQARSCIYSMNPDLKTLVGTESAMRTLPCQGRGTCSGGPRGPPGAGPMVAICYSTLKPPVPHQFHPRRDDFRTMRAA